MTSQITTSSPDFGKAAGEYARHRQGFHPSVFEEYEALGVAFDGADALDIGTGTGLMAREMARRGARVTALDPSADMLAEARTAADAEGLAITHLQARAEETGLPDGAFDIVSAAMCWHWFDREAAAAECLRLLRPGGRLLISSQEWLIQPGNLLDRTVQTVRRYSTPPENRRWTFRYPEWMLEMHAAGFADFRMFGFPVTLIYTHEAWIGRMVASAYVGPVLSADDIAAFREELAGVLSAQYPDPVVVPHRVFCLLFRKDQT